MLTNNPSNIWKNKTIPIAHHDPKYDSKNNERIFSWFGTDSYENYIKNGNKIFSKDCITYDINSFGYRTKEFDQINKDAFQILVCGCSQTFGMGLRIEMRYGEQLKELIQQKYNLQEIEIINLGIGGRSIDFVVRTIFQSIFVLNPDYVFCLLPDLIRREYISYNNNEIFPKHFGIWVRKEDGFSDISNEDFSIAMTTLMSDEWDFFSFIKNISFLEFILKDYQWSWDTWSKRLISVTHDINNLEQYLDITHYRQQNTLLFQNERARDNLHFGPNYH